jgi:hypothetical protein
MGQIRQAHTHLHLIFESDPRSKQKCDGDAALQTTSASKPVVRGSTPDEPHVFKEKNMLLIIILIVLIFGFGYGGYRVGPGWGYYGGGGLSLLLTIALVLLLLRVI